MKTSLTAIAALVAFAVAAPAFAQVTVKDPWVRATVPQQMATGAFMQLYREEGWYLERTVHYLRRVGMDHVKKKILDDEAQRKALWARLQHALEGEPDPWFELSKAQVDTRQFQPIVTA